MEFLLGHVEPEVFPAPVGINRHTEILKPGWSCVPRASGDKPHAKKGEGGKKECSPRQRG
ncbi:hypothetical protein HRJ00_001703 [Escherichia coli]|nr:hypothetical protein [Escherichia coli]